LSENSNKLTSLARVIEKSGQEFHEMTKRMKIDARHLKSFAEITTFFLPLINARHKLDPQKKKSH
jgi:hypothetical protein